MRGASARPGSERDDDDPEERERSGAASFKMSFEVVRTHSLTRRNETVMSGRLNRTRGTGLEDPGARFRAVPELPKVRATSEERILIVDDENSIRLICRLNLGSSGFATLEAADGESAVAAARSEQPDLILLDVMLPGKDGWHVAEELASRADTREIPILFLSARSDRSDESRGYELGGLGYITKPFDPNAMTDRVRDVLERLSRGERNEIRREWRDRIHHD